MPKHIVRLAAIVIGTGLHQNGKLVLGESIGDLGGLSIAYAAYEKSIEGNRPKDIDGFTPEQRFFLGWAQVWGSNQRAEAARLQTNTDPHPLGPFRGNGPVSNLEGQARNLTPFLNTGFAHREVHIATEAASRHGPNPAER